MKNAKVNSIPTYLVITSYQKKITYARLKSGGHGSMATCLTNASIVFKRLRPSTLQIIPI